MRDEIDFSSGERGKYADRVGELTTLVALDPDVAEAFPTEDAVNEALRTLAKHRASVVAPEDVG